MSQSIQDFDYILPASLIAQSPANPRENAHLMVIDKHTGQRTHTTVARFPDYFQSGDVIVVNNSKVFHARLHGIIESKKVELFLIRPTHSNEWLALGKPGKKIIVGNNISIAENFQALVKEKHTDGTLYVSFDKPHDEVIRLANIYGEVPVPPYIKTIPKESDYQTVYAKPVGSVAAPTAGFHLTKHILSELEKKGVTIVEITLHVGLGTFLPVKSVTLDTHIMHSEWVQVTKDVADSIVQAKQHHRRIIAIGTTTVRTLEGVASNNNGQLRAYEGDINIFITPGFHFRVIDGMLTNFHLPKSTLIVLVSAFAGRDTILSAYHEAVEKQYRFYSFGDAMLIL
jgi:S-adenosylmethionine:tRNA ribosyltransferase-isomerase